MILKMNKRKICVVLTARTSYAKIKMILKAVDKHPDLELMVVCAASAVLERFGRTDMMVERDGFKVDERVFMMVDGSDLLTSAKSTGLGVVEFAGAFDRLKPDAVLVMADRFEILAPSIAASYQNIPLVHVQGGEVSGNIDEKVRHAVTKLADIHFPATEQARENIIRMGEKPEQVFCTGCPSIDIAKDVLESPEFDFDLEKKYPGVGAWNKLQDGYYVVLQHPVTTEVNDGLRQIGETLYAMKDCGSQVLWLWPNIDAGGDKVSKGMRVFRELNEADNMYFIKNMEPQDFMRLLVHSKGIVGNSSVAIRECSYLGVPAVDIGSRQSNREHAENVINVDYDREQILMAVKDHCGRKLSSSSLYGCGNASEQIAQCLSKITLTFMKSLGFSL